jgi:hypothetical protein
MDLQTLQQRALAAREIGHSVGGIDYRLRVPTKHEVQVAAYRAGVANKSDAAAYVVLMRSVLQAAIIGWQGARVGHVVSGGDDAATPLPWSVDAVPLLLDARPAHAEALTDALNAGIAQREAALEADAKN